MLVVQQQDGLADGRVLKGHAAGGAGAVDGAAHDAALRELGVRKGEQGLELGQGEGGNNERHG